MLKVQLLSKEFFILYIVAVTSTVRWMFVSLSTVFDVDDFSVTCVNYQAICADSISDIGISAIKGRWTTFDAYSEGAVILEQRHLLE